MLYPYGENLTINFQQITEIEELILKSKKTKYWPKSLKGRIATSIESDVFDKNIKHSMIIYKKSIMVTTLRMPQKMSVYS